MKATIISKGSLFKTVCIISALFLVSWFLIALPDSLKKPEPSVKASSLTVNTVEEGNIRRTEYRDAEGKLTYASDKHFAVRVTTFSENERLDEYFDEKGNPARQTSGHYALLREYNPDGQMWRQTYLGQDGQPIVNTSGYTVLHRYYYAEGPFAGKAEYDFYFDSNENPVKLSLGQSGVRREYDEKGRNNVLTYLDADGQVILTNKGYATVVRTFDENNKILTEMYYDIGGKPVSLAKGHYGILRENGMVTYLDEEGNELFILSSFLLSYPLIIFLLGSAVVFISMLGSRKVNLALLAVYVGFIFYMTLLYRETGEARARLELFWSYKQFFTSKSIRQEILNNIWLFIPLGTIVCRLSSGKRYLILLFLLSVGIEVVQYVSGMGLAEFDDVISNALGAAIGWMIVFRGDDMQRRMMPKIDEYKDECYNEVC